LSYSHRCAFDYNNTRRTAGIPPALPSPSACCNWCMARIRSGYGLAEFSAI